MQDVQGWLRRVDRAVYRGVAALPTPALDRPLRLLTDFADFSKLWLTIAALLAVFGGRRGRRAALTGVAAIGAASFVVNQPLKATHVRARPDREGAGVPRSRWADMPDSTSFPSGHSASAAAFAVAVGDLLPELRVPLRTLAAIVAFSRTYTGVHYPGDVVIGVAAGAIVGRVTSETAQRLRARLSVRRTGGRTP